MSFLLNFGPGTKVGNGQHGDTYRKRSVRSPLRPFIRKRIRNCNARSMANEVKFQSLAHSMGLAPAVLGVEPGKCFIDMGYLTGSTLGTIVESTGSIPV